uniref:Uncharacterized protein n=1 Tax=Oryza brachyantha TaxID=4533 RepID=J3NCW6_ORYBR
MYSYLGRILCMHSIHMGRNVPCTCTTTNVLNISSLYVVYLVRSHSLNYESTDIFVGCELQRHSFGLYALNTLLLHIFTISLVS